MNILKSHSTFLHFVFLAAMLLCPAFFESAPALLQFLIAFSITFGLLLMLMLFKYLFPNFYDKASSKVLKFLNRGLNEEQIAKRYRLEFIGFLLIVFLSFINGFILQFIHQWVDPLLASAVLIITYLTFLKVVCAIKNIICVKSPISAAVTLLVIIPAFLIWLSTKGPLVYKGSLTSSAVFLIMLVFFLIESIAMLVQYYKM